VLGHAEASAYLSVQSSSSNRIQSPGVMSLGVAWVLVLEAVRRKMWMAGSGAGLM